MNHAIRRFDYTFHFTEETIAKTRQRPARSYTKKLSSWRSKPAGIQMFAF